MRDKCPICGKQSLSNYTPYCREHVNIVGKSDINTSVSELLKDIVDKSVLEMETLDTENLVMTEDMCKNFYKLAVEDTKRYIKDVYYSLNWFQRLLWRILGLNRLWSNESKKSS